MLANIGISFFVFAVSCGIISAEEECMRSDPIDCYVCDSDFDKRCRDPFNYTIMEEIPYKPCKGCCVKIVQKYNTSKERIRRGCTRQLVVNLFMIDHVCMKEHDKTGHMCFCEYNLCNKSGRANFSALPLGITALLLYYIWTF